MRAYFRLVPRLASLRNPKTCRASGFVLVGHAEGAPKRCSGTSGLGSRPGSRDGTWTYNAVPADVPQPFRVDRRQSGHYPPPAGSFRVARNLGAIRTGYMHEMATPRPRGCQLPRGDLGATRAPEVVSMCRRIRNAGLGAASLFRGQTGDRLVEKQSSTRGVGPRGRQSNTLGGRHARRTHSATISKLTEWTIDPSRPARL